MATHSRRSEWTQTTSLDAWVDNLIQSTDLRFQIICRAFHHHQPAHETVFTCLTLQLTNKTYRTIKMNQFGSIKRQLVQSQSLRVYDHHRTFVLLRQEAVYCHVHQRSLEDKHCIKYWSKDRLPFTHISIIIHNLSSRLKNLLILFKFTPVSLLNVFVAQFFSPVETTYEVIIVEIFERKRNFAPLQMCP